MITSVKSLPFILESPWQLSLSWNRENNNLLLFLKIEKENQPKKKEKKKKKRETCPQRDLNLRLKKGLRKVNISSLQWLTVLRNKFLVFFIQLWNISLSLTRQKVKNKIIFIWKSRLNLIKRSFTTFFPTYLDVLLSWEYRAV